MASKKQNPVIDSINLMDEAQSIAKIGCWEHDHLTDTILWSKEQFRLLGLSATNAKPSLLLFSELIHPRDRLEQREAYESHLKDGSEYNLEFRMVLRDGTLKYIHSKARTERDDKSGSPVRTIGTCSDITKRARARIELEVTKNDLEVIVEDRVAELELMVEDLRETNLALKNTQSQLIQSEKMASLGVLTAGIAHEINNPVNFIYGGITAVEENLKDVEKMLEAYGLLNINNASEKLQEIERLKVELQLDKVLKFLKRSTVNVKSGAERTTKIIKGLRSFSRMDDSLPSFTDIRECVDNSLLILAKQYEDRISIDKDFEKSPKIECFPGKISQVFVNIISNAIHAIEGNGEIGIRSRNVKKDGKNFLRLSFSDTGSGIPKEVQEHIFEPFYTTKKVGKGTGLGLSISHGIIEEHHGTIEFESEEGIGTTFTIELPYSQRRS